MESSSSRYNDNSDHHSERDRKRRHSRRDDFDDRNDNEYEHHHQRRHSSSRHYDDHRRHSDDRRKSDTRRSRHSSESSSSSEEEAFKFKKFGEILSKHTTIERELPPDLSEMMARNTIPCFDRQLDFEGIEFRRKFFEDAKVGDLLVCRVVLINSTSVELKPECTLSRYRRCLYRVPFPPTSVITICEPELLACSKGDMILATIAQLDYVNLKLYLTINNYGIPLKPHELPAYYRKLPEISLDEPDLNVILGLTPFYADFSALPELRDKDLDNPRKGPQALREKLAKETATKLVEKAAALVREKKNDEGIEVFNEALQAWQNFVPALIGRSAAYANQKRFDEAILDLQIVREIEPENETANQYYLTVLMVYGQQMEAEGSLESALEKYSEAIELFDDNRARVLFSELKSKIEESKKKVMKEKEEIEKREKQQKSKQEQRENAKKLKEMEKFIESLKKKK